MSSEPQLVVAGNLLLDDVVYADGTTRMGQPGGAALYAALGAALWGVRVGIVSRLGSDYPGDVIDTLADRASPSPATMDRRARRCAPGCSTKTGGGA